MPIKNPTTKFLEAHLKNIENAKKQYIGGEIDIKSFRDNFLIDLQGWIAIKEFASKKINTQDKKLYDSIKSFSHLIPEEYKNRIW